MNPGCKHFLRGFRDAILVGGILAAIFFADRLFSTSIMPDDQPASATLNAANTP